MNSDTLLHYNLKPSLHVKAFSTTRISPFSFSEGELAQMGAYAAFNVTDYCHDIPERVEQNRKWLSSHLGISPDRLIMPRQTHTANIRVLTEDFFTQEEAQGKEQRQDGDALVTKRRGLCMGVATADCVPVLIADEGQQICAAIHAGWRGTVQHIVKKTALLMQHELGCKPNCMHAVIGPSISPQAYEVGEEVVDAFEQAGFHLPSIVQRNATSTSSLPPKPHIDLWAANCIELEEASIPLDQIQISGICTYTHADTFFSARRLGIRSGRIFTGIMMEEA